MFVFKLPSILAAFVALTLISCMQSLPVLEVKQDRVSLEHVRSEDQMVAFNSESELNKHIHPRDRQAAHGEYFTFLWDNLEQGLGADASDDLRLIFYYRASKTQSKVLKKVWNIQGELRKSQILKFAYTQKWVEDKGHLLSWRAEIKSANRVLAEQQSYLWKDSY